MLLRSICIEILVCFFTYYILQLFSSFITVAYRNSGRHYNIFSHPILLPLIFVLTVYIMEIIRRTRPIITRKSFRKHDTFCGMIHMKNPQTNIIGLHFQIRFPRLSLLIWSDIIYVMIQCVIMSRRTVRRHQKDSSLPCHWQRMSTSGLTTTPRR